MCFQKDTMIVLPNIIQKTNIPHVTKNKFSKSLNWIKYFLLLKKLIIYRRHFSFFFFFYLKPLESIIWGARFLRLLILGYIVTWSTAQDVFCIRLHTWSHAYWKVSRVWSGRYCYFQLVPLKLRSTPQRVQVN